MYPFVQHIDKVAEEISVQKEDRAAYASDFDEIRDYLLGVMKKVSPVFKHIYGGPSLFGSFAENLRVNLPDEFDVHFMLKLPFYENIKLSADHKRPGFIKLCLSTVLRKMRDSPQHNFVFEVFEDFVDVNYFLRRNKLQEWLEDIINEGLETYGDSFQTKYGITYELEYFKRGTAHTIKAYSNQRNLSIDFVPAFKFNANEDWLVPKGFPFDLDTSKMIWFAVPKPTVGPKSRSRQLTFSVCAPQIEKHILLNKQNLKPSLRLIKSLTRGNYKLKSYFIKSAYLLENEKQPEEFWHKPTAEILVHMIDVILDYLEDECLPFYWDRRLNLLDGLKKDRLSQITDNFEKVLDILKNYYHQPNIGYKTVRRLFGQPFDPERHGLNKEI